MKVIATLIISLFLFEGSAQVVLQHLQSNNQTVSFPFLMFSPDARSSGLADIGSALSPNSNSFHWNTSNLGFSNNAGELSASYTPWLRQLANGIHLLYVSGYSKFGSDQRHCLGGSLRYLSDANKYSINGIAPISDNVKSNDVEILGGYSFRVSDKSSIGANGKFIFSDALQNANPDSLNVPLALAGALDLSYGYFSENIALGGLQGNWSWGVTLSNLGNKSFYTNISDKDFLPANFRIGSAFGINIRDKHKITTAFDVNKLMVPSSADNINNTTAIQGVFKSFADAQDGLIGEIRELSFGAGIEYNLKNIFSLRTGYFYENPSQGSRRFVSFGAGVQFKSIGVDVSYLASFTRTNPISNTMRFSLSYTFSKS